MEKEEQTADDSKIEDGSERGHAEKTLCLRMPTGAIWRICGRPHYEIEHLKGARPVVVSEALWHRHYAPFTDQQTLAEQHASYFRGLDSAIKVWKVLPNRRNTNLQFWTAVLEWAGFQANIVQDDSGVILSVISDVTPEL